VGRPAPGRREDERLVREAGEHERAPRLAEIPPLHPKLLAALREQGIEDLFSHQVEAVHAAMEGDFVVTTGTASGKSMCFNLPTLHHLLQNPTSRALYLYPTKALSQDQARALHRFGLHKEIRPAIYDGDTPREERAAIRKRANIVLTNPDMLHVGILPNHRAWADFLHRLDVVVVDEAHVYRGVFGSHVANVLRRLRRLAPHVRFFMASATIANPVELAERLTGLDDIALVESDGSPKARRKIAIWNPPLVDEALGVRRSSLAEAPTCSSTSSARGADDLLHQVAQGRRADDEDRPGQAARRRAGARRLGRALPRRLHRPAAPRDRAPARLGDLRAVVTTDALELGIDIGALDAAVVVTFPGTVASLRQMWGAPGAAGAAWPSTSPARTRWTSSSAATPTSSSTAPSRRRSSTTSPSRSTCSTCCAPRTRRR
jgi:DEAD/DEAH box helicase domain-containing protein